ncbi:MAG: hypothetical protein AAF675_03190 [Pseudomonadota bacterium]
MSAAYRIFLALPLALGLWGMASAEAGSWGVSGYASGSGSGYGEVKPLAPAPFVGTGRGGRVTGSDRVRRVQRGPRGAGALGASIRSNSPVLRQNAGDGAGRIELPGRRFGHSYLARGYPIGLPYGYGWGYGGRYGDRRDAEVTVVTPPADPEPEPVEAEPEIMTPATPVTRRVGTAGPPVRFAVDLAAEGETAAGLARLLADRRETLRTALILTGIPFCVLEDTGFEIGRTTGAASFSGTARVTLETTAPDAFLDAIAALPAETIAGLSETDGRRAETTAVQSDITRPILRRPPAAGARCS